MASHLPHDSDLQAPGRALWETQNENVCRGTTVEPDAGGLWADSINVDNRIIVSSNMKATFRALYPEAIPAASEHNLRTEYSIRAAAKSRHSRKPGTRSTALDTARQTTTNQ